MTDDMDEEKAIFEALKKIMTDLTKGKAKIDVVKMDMSQDKLEEMRDLHDKISAIEQKMPKNELQFMEWADDFINDTYRQLVESGLDNLRIVGILEKLKFKFMCPSETHTFNPIIKKAGKNEKPKRKAKKKKLVSK